MSENQYLSQVEFAKHLTGLMNREVSKQNVAYYKTKGLLVMKPGMKVSNSGDTSFLKNDHVLKTEFNSENERVGKNNGQPAKGRAVQIVDVEKSLSRLSENLDLAHVKTLPDSDSPESPSIPKSEKTESGTSYNFQKNRARREKYNADMTEMDALEKAGSLTPTDQVNNQAFSTAVRTRDAMLSIPPLVSTTLVSMCDPFEIEKFLVAEFEKKLRTLADALALELSPPVQEEEECA